MSASLTSVHDEQAAIAWGAAVRRLRDQRWHQWDTVVSVISDASGLHPRGAGPVLMDGCRLGYLVRQGMAGRRQVRLTPRGLAAFPSESTGA